MCRSLVLNHERSHLTKRQTLTAAGISKTRNLSKELIQRRVEDEKD